MCLQMGRTLEEGGMLETDEFYVKSGEEMAALFADVPEALANTVKLPSSAMWRSKWGASACPALRCPMALPTKAIWSIWCSKGWPGAMARNAPRAKKFKSAPATGLKPSWIWAL